MPKKSRSRKTSRKVSRKTRKSCESYLRKKIRANMKEYNEGRYASRQQAIAISYSQTRKRFPSCSRYFSR